jgi:hypothetical protein
MKLGEIVHRCEQDPEDTMHLTVTKKELGVILFALHFVHRIFPEMSKFVEGLCEKLEEISRHQEFLRKPDEE